MNWAYVPLRKTLHLKVLTRVRRVGVPAGQYREPFVLEECKKDFHQNNATANGVTFINWYSLNRGIIFRRPEKSVSNLRLRKKSSICVGTLIENSRKIKATVQPGLKCYGIEIDISLTPEILECVLVVFLQESFKIQSEEVMLIGAFTHMTACYPTRPLRFE